LTKNQFHFVCKEEGKRLDIFLSEKLSLTRTKIKDIIEGGHVRIAGKTPKPSIKIKNLMEIDGEIPAEEPLTLTPQEIPLEILYEDKYFLAVNKPKDMVVHPSFGHKEGTLVNAVLAYLGQGEEDRGQENVECLMLNAASLNPGEGGTSEKQENTHQSILSSSNHKLRYTNLRPGIVHRLDKGTTGVIIVAKDSKTQEMLSALFKKRTVRKTYRAIVEGVIDRKEGAIEGNIGRHPIDRKKMAVLKEGGRDAATSFKVIKQLDGFAYVEAYPKTGRTHQIRVHLSHIGHPVAGDEMYGKKAKHIADRPLLHAYKIEFIHPVMGTPIIIEAPMPDDLTEFIEKYTL
jgi:23S rRNA pseudouridine1911/1915/1917 synthase